MRDGGEHFEDSSRGRRLRGIRNTSGVVRRVARETRGMEKRGKTHRLRLADAKPGGGGGIADELLVGLLVILGHNAAQLKVLVGESIDARHLGGSGRGVGGAPTESVVAAGLYRPPP